MYGKRALLILELYMATVSSSYKPFITCLEGFDYLSSDNFIVIIKAFANESAVEHHIDPNNALC